MDTVQISQSEVTAAYPGLIGHEKKNEFSVLQPPHGLRYAGEQCDLVRVAQIMTFLDQSSVAVKEYGG
jgi:hypothetical protein